MIVPAPEISVVICTLDGASTINEALDSLAAQVTEISWELVVSDNGSTDSTQSAVRGHPILGAGARIVDASGRRGLAHARNVGAAAARGTFVTFVDDDDVVDPEWLQALTEALRERRFVGSAMAYDRLNDASTMVGRAAFQSTELGSFAGFAVVNGAGFGVERELWDAVGGNDESFDISCEDFDFAIRVQRECGVAPVLAERAVYHYRQRAGAWRAFRQGRRYGKGQVQLAARHDPGRTSNDVRRALRMWWWILTRAPFHLFSDRRTMWARQLGLRVGRLEGSITERTWYP